MNHDYSNLDFTGKTPEQIKEMKKKARSLARKTAQRAGTYTPRASNPAEPTSTDIRVARGKGVAVPTRKRGTPPPAPQTPGPTIRMTKNPDDTYNIFVNKDLIHASLGEQEGRLRLAELRLLNETNPRELSEQARYIKACRVALGLPEGSIPLHIQEKIDAYEASLV